MAGLPVGTVTLLFTDIEGSTQRWDRNRAAMQAAVHRHDDLLRAGIASKNGRVFKTIGDAFCASFWHPEEAVAAAIDIQRSLGAEDFSSVDGLRVRMALHTGTTDARDGDYFGPTVNRVARILSTGHGGQILASAITAELVRQHLGEQASLRDLGEHRLKDLSFPERIFQIEAAGVSADFPRLRSLSVLDNNLPQQLSSFVGRERDVNAIRGLLESARLVTLFGSGGVGKTRCALQVGAELLDSFAEGAWFVDFAPLTDSGLVVSEIASLFHVQESTGEGLLAALCGYLRTKSALLIFDNCEHVIAESARTAAVLLRTCSKVKILATSRESLAIPGEVVYRMPSLTVPEHSAAIKAAEALTYGAVALFEARSRAANPRFELNDDNAPIIADVCKRLDGIPLAIELAAARVKVLGPRQLAQKLDERFRLLTGGDRTALPRQQTMRALIDWSYDLLSEQERTVFRRLSVFSGSFSLESAGAVCSDDMIEEFDVLDSTSSLVDKSLLNTEHAGDEVRYRLLESTRQYAREKLIADGDFEELSRRHAGFFLQQAIELNRLWDSSPDREWIERAILDLDNFRAAISWALIDEHDVAGGQQLAGYLYWLWREFAPAEGRRYIDLAVQRIGDGTPALIRAELDLVKAGLDMLSAKYKSSLARSQHLLEAFDADAEPMLAGYARMAAGRSLIFLERFDEGEAMLQSALALFRSGGGRKSVATVLENLGLMHSFLGDVSKARSCLMEAIATYKAVGATGRVPNTLDLLAGVEFRAGDTAEALKIATEALEAFRAIRFAPTMPSHLANLSAYLIKADRFDEACDRAHEALALACDSQQEVFAADALGHLAAIAALRPCAAGSAQSERSRAARLFGFVNARYDALEARRETTEQQEYERAMIALELSFEAGALASLMEEGAAWPEERALAEAHAIDSDRAVAA